MRRTAIGIVVALLGLGLIWLETRDRVSSAEPAAEPALPAPPQSQLDAPVAQPSADAPADGERAPVEARALAEDAPPGMIALSGRVFDLPPGGDREGRTPAPGVTVRLSLGLFALGSDDPAPEASTDEEGRFRLLCEDDGRRPRVMSVWADGDEAQRGAKAERRIGEGESVVAELELERPALGALAGVVVDVLGEPVAGVEIRLPKESPELAATTDEEGRFQFRSASASSEMAVEKPGYVVVEAPSPRHREGGGWVPAHVVLAPAGALRVSVVNPAGGPLPGLHVAVEVSSAEPVGWGRGRSFRFDEFNKIRPVATDDAGVAFFPSIWAGQRLRIECSGILRAFEQVREVEGGARAVSEGGAPIVVPIGGELEIAIELGGSFRVSGRVVSAERAPVAEASLFLRTLDIPRYTPGYAEGKAHTDEQGAFEIELFSDAALGRLRLSAADRSHLFAFHWGDDEQLSSAWMDFDAAQGNEHTGVVLVLQPTLAIGGRVVDEKGQGLSGQVRVRRAGGDAFLTSLPSGVQPSCSVGKEGDFRIIGLAPGRYDVEALPHERARVWARGVAAGEQDLVLTASEARPVKVHVDVSADVELEQVIVLTGQLEPHAGSPSTQRESAPVLGSGTYTAPFGWPRDMLGLWYGGGGSSSELGKSRFLLLPVSEFPHTIELNEGLGWIGVKARTPDGTYTFPVGTGLVRLRAGEYRLDFRQRPGASIEGRVRGIPAGEEWFAAVAVPGGAPIPVDVRRKQMHEWNAIGAHGTFAFPLVPMGELELRLGTQEDLLGGGWRLREGLVLSGGETSELELEVP